MRFNICQKTIIIHCLALFCFTINVFGQFKNFGQKAKFKPEPNYVFSIYGYYDVIREYGLGFQCQLNNKYSLDVSVYKVYPYGYLYKKILQWDYYDFQGYGLSLKPKFMFSSRNRLYVGLNLSYEQLFHKAVPINYYFGRDSDPYYTMTESKGYGANIGITFGNKFSYKFIFLEPFFSVGVTETHTQNTDYSSTSSRLNLWEKYPESYSQSKAFFYTNIGLKLGFSFKKNKKHAAIDKKFDAVYIPKAISLNNYIKTIDYKKSTTSKYLKEVRNRYNALNRHALAKYKRYYRDTTTFYNKIDSLFSKIDRLIIKGNQ